MDGSQLTHSEAEVNALKAKLYDLQHEMKAAKEREKDLQDQLAARDMGKGAEAEAARDKLEKEVECLRERLDSNINEGNKVMKLLEESKSQEEVLKKAISDHEDTTAWLELSLVKASEEVTKMKEFLQELAQIIKLDYLEEEEPCAFFARVIDQCKQVVESSERKVAQGQNLLQDLGNFYQSACVTMGSAPDCVPQTGNGACSHPASFSVTPAESTPNSNQENSDSDMIVDSDDNLPQFPPPTSPENAPLQGPTCARDGASPSTSAGVGHASTSESPGPVTRKRCRRPTNWYGNGQSTKFADSKGDHGKFIDVPATANGSASRFQCKCGKVFRAESTFRTHIRKMEQEWKYQCESCGLYYFFPCDLRVHQMSKECCQPAAGMEIYKPVKAPGSQRRVRARRAPAKAMEGNGQESPEGMPNLNTAEELMDGIGRSTNPPELSLETTNSSHMDPVE